MTDPRDQDHLTVDRMWKTRTANDDYLRTCKYAPGDKLRVVDADAAYDILVVGETYEVEHTMGLYVQLVGRPEHEWWDESRFEPATDEHHDPVSMPPHYRALPVECIDVSEHFTFCAGNALKYLWRHLHKGKPIEDLKKAAWYIEREIQRLEKEQGQ